MELFEVIRRDKREEGLSVRALADRHRVHRRTVRQALASARPPARSVAQREAPVMGPLIGTVREWLVADRAAPRKQRHTARRIWERLVEEKEAGVAESTVRQTVRELRMELESGIADVMVVGLHEPGAEALCGFPHRASYAASANMRRRARQGRRLSLAGPV